MDNKKGRNSVSKALLEERRRYSTSLKEAGFKTKEIAYKVNALAQKKHWGTITERTVKRDINNYYEDNAVIEFDDIEENFHLRESHMEIMEKVMEKMALYIREKKHWKPSEYQSAVYKYFMALAKYAELQNWNYSKKNAHFDLKNIIIRKTLK